MANFDIRSLKTMKRLTTILIEYFDIKKNSKNKKYYKQINGVVSSSLLGPTFANLLLVYYENTWLGKSPPPLQFKPKYYCRYVDGIFLMFEKKDHVKKILKHITLVIKILNLHLNTIITSHFRTNQ